MFDSANVRFEITGRTPQTAKFDIVFSRANVRLEMQMLAYSIPSGSDSFQRMLFHFLSMHLLICKVIPTTRETLHMNYVCVALQAAEIMFDLMMNCIM